MTGRSVVETWLVALALASASASPAMAAETAAAAPGRIALSDSAGNAIALLPDGGFVLAGSDGDVLVTRLRANGAVERAFGTNGTARVAVGKGPEVAQVLATPDGAILVVVAENGAESGTAFRALSVVRFTADGRLDASFGDGGIAQAAIHRSYDIQGPAALGADGSVVIAGDTGTYGRDLQPAVAKLTPAGRPDAQFGGGVVRLPGGPRHDRGSWNAAIAASGQILVSYKHHIAALTAAGTPDPSFNGGAPVRLSGAQQIVARPDGRIDALRVSETATRIVRFTREGAIERAFRLRYRPSALAQRLFLGAGDTTTLIQEIGPPDPPAGEHPVAIDVHRLTADGRLLARTTLRPRFGGGGAATDVEFPLVQNAFRTWDIAVRPDGAYLVAGTVDVLRRAEGGSHGARVPVVAAFTPAFAPDRAFGGPSRAKLRVSLRTRRMATVLERGGLPLRLAASAPGLVRLTLRDPRGRTIAGRVAPIFDTAALRTSIRIPPPARQRLRALRGARLRLTYEFRDVVAVGVRGTDRIALR